MSRQPLLARLLHRLLASLLSFGICCSKVGLAVLGPLLVSIAVSVIGFTAGVYFLYTYPALTSPGHHNLSPLVANAITAFGLYLLFLTLFHYFTTMRTKPGFPPPASHWTPAMLAALSNDPGLHSKSTLPYRRCSSCEVVKPMRTHHCSICGACVLKMDHHCPWVNNCVGWHNYRHFTLFCLYLFLVALFFIVTSADVVMASLTGRLADEDWSVLVASVCSLSGCIAAALFLLWNAYLSCTNQTTIEFYGNVLDGTVSANPYDMGWRHNLYAVYGPSVLRNVLLPVRQDPPGDGCLFPMNRGRGYPLPQLANDASV